MEIKIKKNSYYKDVRIEEFNTIIDLGLHDDEECKRLAQVFIQAAEELLEGIEDDGLQESTAL